MMHNLNSFTTIESDNESRLSSIAIDVESQESISNKNQDTNLSTPLRGILKNSSDFSKENTLFYTKAVKIINVLTLFIICIPIIFCDIYYGYSKKKCVDINPDYLNISLKLYLLLSGFMNIFLLMLASIIILFDDINLTNHFYNELICIIKKNGTYIFGMFSLIWNIAGSIIFWGYYYENDMCDKYVSTYIFISLLIKLLSSSIYLYSKISK
jgi:hypothetical protein